MFIRPNKNLNLTTLIPDLCYFRRHDRIWASTKDSVHASDHIFRQSHYREVPWWGVSNGARHNWKCFLAYLRFIINQRKKNYLYFNADASIFLRFFLSMKTHPQIVRNHVKLRGFSKDTLLFGGFWLWAWRISCRKVESTKWLKYKLRATIGGQ